MADNTREAQAKVSQDGEEQTIGDARCCGNLTEQIAPTGEPLAGS